MTDAGAPRTNLLVYIPEDPARPLLEIEYDIRSAARLVAFSGWAGSGAFSEQDDGVLQPESIDSLAVRRIGYGSPLTVAFEMLPYAISWAVAATPTVMGIMRGIGYLRKDFAAAGELDARRDSEREDVFTKRSDRADVSTSAGSLGSERPLRTINATSSRTVTKLVSFVI